MLVVFHSLFADEVTTGTYNFVSLIVKIILLEIEFASAAPAADQTQPFSLNC